MGAGGRGISRPTMPRMIDGLDTRVFGLETRRPLDDRPPSERYEKEFSMWGPLMTVTSAPLPIRVSSRLTAVMFMLTTAGSTDTEFAVNKSGSVIAPTGVDGNMTTAFSVLTLTTPNTVGIAYFDEVFSKDVDYLDVQVITVGTGAETMTAQARFG